MSQWERNWYDTRLQRDLQSLRDTNRSFSILLLSLDSEIVSYYTDSRPPPTIAAPLGYRIGRQLRGNPWPGRRNEIHWIAMRTSIAHWNLLTFTFCWVRAKDEPGKYIIHKSVTTNSIKASRATTTEELQWQSNSGWGRYSITTIWCNEKGVYVGGMAACEEVMMALRWL